MPDPTRKPVEKRQNRVTRSLEVVVGGPVVRPAPEGIGSTATQAWHAYWADVIANTIQSSDEAVVERWVRNLHRYHCLLAVADEQPLTQGSTGQVKANPAYDLAYKIEASIKADEQQLGIGPLNRLRLGVAFTEGVKSLSDLNAEAEAGDGADPRIGLLGGGASLA